MRACMHGQGQEAKVQARGIYLGGGNRGVGDGRYFFPLVCGNHLLKALNLASHGIFRMGGE